MAEKNQLHPLAPAGIYRRSDEEFAMYKRSASRQEKSSKCLVYILAGIVIQSILILVFASIVLRVNAPDVKLRSVAVKNLRYGTAPSASLNVTLIAEVTVKNSNFGRLEIENSTASVLYGDMKVTDMKISMGRVKARETKGMNVTVEVRSNRLDDNYNPGSGSDINSGMLKLRSYGKLSSTVHLLKIIKKRKMSEMNCTMTLNLTSSVIQDLLCT